MHSSSSGLFRISWGTWDRTTLLIGIFLGISGFLGAEVVDKAVLVRVEGEGARGERLESVVGVGSWVSIFFLGFLLFLFVLIKVFTF